jgi:hypothetical protein
LPVVAATCRTRQSQFARGLIRRHNSLQQLQRSVLETNERVADRRECQRTEWSFGGSYGAWCMLWVHILTHKPCAPRSACPVWLQLNRLSARFWTLSGIQCTRRECTTPTMTNTCSLRTSQRVVCDATSGVAAGGFAAVEGGFYRGDAMRSKPPWPFSLARSSGLLLLSPWNDVCS